MEQVEDLRERHRVPILALVVGAGVSTLGTLMTLIAVPWFVLQTTGSVTKTGVTTAIWVLPVILSGALAGPIVDRIGHWQAGVAGDVGAGLCVAAVPTLYHTVGLPFLSLLGIVFLRGLFDFPGRTGRQSLIPELADLAAMSLERANSAFATVRGLALLIGPAAAGILVSRFSASNVMWIDAVTYAFSALMTGIFVPATPRGVRSVVREPYRDRLLAGFRVVRGDSVLLTLLVFTTVSTLLTSPLFDVEMPVYSRNVFGSAIALGLMSASYGAGTLAASLLYAAIGDRFQRRGILLGYALVTGASLAALAVEPALPFCIVILGLVGFATGPIGPLYQTVVQERVPPEVRGRVFGLSGVTMAAIPLGALGSGLVLQVAGMQLTLGLQAIAIISGAIGLWRSPALRKIEACTLQDANALETETEITR